MLIEGEFSVKLSGEALKALSKDEWEKYDRLTVKTADLLSLKLPTV